MSKAPSNSGRNMALTAAFLGWLFDGFEMGLFPLIGSPALADLLKVEPSNPVVLNWFNVILATFLVGAATGGVLFGWLGDRIGRVRAMSLSIFTYAIFTGLCGLATEAWHIAGLRFIASLGMGGEWALGVALVNELWTKGNRAFIAGMIGAAANVGYLLVALLSLSLVSFIAEVKDIFIACGMGQQLADSWFSNGGWRFLMITGALPALLIFLIQIFVPESHKWEEEKASGATSHWSNSDMLGVLAGGLTALVIIFCWSPLGPQYGITPIYAAIITLTGLGVVFWGYIFPVKSYLRRAGIAGAMQSADSALIMRHLLIGASLAGVALLGTWGAAQQAPKWAIDLNNATGKLSAHPKEYVQMTTSIGAIIFTLITPIIGDILGRRLTYSICCALAGISAVVFYQFCHTIDTTFYVAAFLMGGLTATFYGFFPLYLPELFPTSVRATGQGFCFNVGRIIAAVGGLQIANLVGLFGTADTPAFAKAASAYTVLCGIYLVGIFIVWAAPETKGKGLT